MLSDKLKCCNSLPAYVDYLQVVSPDEAGPCTAMYSAVWIPVTLAFATIVIRASAGTAESEFGVGSDKVQRIILETQ